MCERIGKDHDRRKIYEIAVNDLCLYAPSVFTRLFDLSKDFDGILNQDNVEAYYKVVSRIPIKDRMHMRNNPVARISATEAEEIAILDALSSAPRDPDVLHGLSDIIHNDYINRLRQTLCLRVCEAYFANRPLEGRRLTREDMIFNNFLAAIKENDKKLHVVTGDVTDQETLRAVIKGKDAVI